MPTAGGMVATTGACFTRDEYARPIDHRLEANGHGRLVAYPRPLTPYAYRDVLSGLLDEAGVARPLRLAGAHGEPVWGVNMRSTQWDGRMLINLANFTRHSQQVKFKSSRPIREAVNLFTNEKVHFPVTLPPLEPVLLEAPQ